MKKPNENMNYGQANEEMKAGHKAWRSGWNGKDMFVFLVSGGSWDFETNIPGVDGLETLPFICMKTADNKLVPWLASQTDLNACDWFSDRVY